MCFNTNKKNEKSDFEELILFNFCSKYKKRASVLLSFFFTGNGSNNLKIKFEIDTMR